MVKDQDFLDYIRRKESDHEEGSSTVDLTPEKLMLLARNKFQTLVDKGTWRSPSKNEEKLIALQSEVERLKMRPKTKTADKPAKWKAKGPLAGQNKANSKKNPKREKEPWMLVAPTAGEPRNKTVKGKEWHFCYHHKEWCR
jgi:hypothetical protein